MGTFFHDDCKKKEWMKRRKIRLQQVRSQSRDIARAIRERSARENRKHELELEKMKEDGLLQWKKQQLAVLEAKYQEAMQNVGIGAATAAAQPDMAVHTKEEAERLRKIAQERGQRAERWREEEAKRKLESAEAPVRRRKVTRDIEDIRSALVVQARDLDVIYKARRDVLLEIPILDIGDWEPNKINQNERTRGSNLQQTNLRTSSSAPLPHTSTQASMSGKTSARSQSSTSGFVDMATTSGNQVEPPLSTRSAVSAFKENISPRTLKSSITSEATTTGRSTTQTHASPRRVELPSDPAASSRPDVRLDSSGRSFETVFSFRPGTYRSSESCSPSRRQAEPTASRRTFVPTVTSPRRRPEPTTSTRPSVLHSPSRQVSSEPYASRRMETSPQRSRSDALSNPVKPSVLGSPARRFARYRPTVGPSNQLYSPPRRECSAERYGTGLNSSPKRLDAVYSKQPAASSRSQMDSSPLRFKLLSPPSSKSEDQMAPPDNRRSVDVERRLSGSDLEDFTEEEATLISKYLSSPQKRKIEEKASVCISKSKKSKRSNRNLLEKVDKAIEEGRRMRSEANVSNDTSDPDPVIQVFVKVNCNGNEMPENRAEAPAVATTSTQTCNCESNMPILEESHRPSACVHHYVHVLPRSSSPNEPDESSIYDSDASVTNSSSRTADQCNCKATQVDTAYYSSSGRRPENNAGPTTVRRRAAAEQLQQAADRETSPVESVDQCNCKAAPVNAAYSGGLLRSVAMPRAATLRQLSSQPIPDKVGVSDTGLPRGTRIARGLSKVTTATVLPKGTRVAPSLSQVTSSAVIPRRPAVSSASTRRSDAATVSTVSAAVPRLYVADKTEINTANIALQRRSAYQFTGAEDVNTANTVLPRRIYPFVSDIPEINTAEDALTAGFSRAPVTPSTSGVSQANTAHTGAVQRSAIERILEESHPDSTAYLGLPSTVDVGTSSVGKSGSVGQSITAASHVNSDSNGASQQTARQQIPPSPGFSKQANNTDVWSSTAYLSPPDHDNNIEFNPQLDYYIRKLLGLPPNAEFTASSNNITSHSTPNEKSDIRESEQTCQRRINELSRELRQVRADTEKILSSSSGGYQTTLTSNGADAARGSNGNDTSMPDLEADLIKRGLITSPFRWSEGASLSTMESDVSPSKEIERRLNNLGMDWAASALRRKPNADSSS